MKTKYSFYLPVIELDSFIKFIKKLKKNVPDVTVEYSEPYQKLFYHSYRDIDGYVYTERKFHDVIDVNAELPIIRNWMLLATFKNDLMFVSNPKEKLQITNPNHGKDYRKCDVCGHYCKNSFLIKNVETNEELQVGCECVKKFGIPQIDWISKFTRELYKVYDCYASDSLDDYPYWKGPKDERAFAAIETTHLFNAAIQHYKESNGKWSSGYYNECNMYVRSYSNIRIQTIVTQDDLRKYPNLFTAIKNYISQIKDGTEFQEKMKSLCNSFYCTSADAPYAYFAIKYYVDYLKSLKEPKLPNLHVGDYVHVVGEVIESKRIDTEFGSFTVHKIQTNKGYKVERLGVIPIIKKDEKNYTEFYSYIKRIHKYGIQLDRATKHPKKVKEIIEL